MSTNKLDRIEPTGELAANPRASLASWLRYSNIVTAAYRQHPRTYIYQPANMAATTVASRIRDAIRGCLAFSYESAIPHADLLRWYSEIVIKNDLAQVFIGPPKQLSASLVGAAKVEDLRYDYDTLTFEEIVAFTMLLSTGRIVGPVKIQNPPDLSLLPERNNVETLPQKDGSLLLL